MGIKFVLVFPLRYIPCKEIMIYMSRTSTSPSFIYNFLYYAG